MNLDLILKCKMKLVHRRYKELIALCIQSPYREDLTKLLHYKVETFLWRGTEALTLDLIAIRNLSSDTSPIIIVALPLLFIWVSKYCFGDSIGVTIVYKDVVSFI